MIKWLAAIVSSVFSMKSLVSLVVLSVLGIIFYNLLVEVIQESMNFALTQLGNTPGTVPSQSLSGFSGWFAAQIKIPECLSVVGSAVSVKFILRKIPFIKW